MSAPELEVREVAVEGRRARWRVAGEGEPLVLLHGLSGSWRWWRPLLGRLAVLRGEPHACHYSAPDRVAALVLEEREQGSGDLGGSVEHRDVPGAGHDDDSRVS